MRILVTRPREDSERLAEKLEAMGHEVLIEPLFTIEPELGAPLDLDGVQALLLTSANGVRALALRSERRDIPVLAVGDATAAAARDFGFAQVESAGGDVEDLADLVRARLRPDGGALLHAAGSVTAGDLAGNLGAAGYDVRRVVLYRAEPVGALSAETAAALRDGRIDLAVFFSPRTARTFVSLVKAAGLESACARIAVLGLSQAVLDAASEIGWAAHGAAAEPTEASLLDALAQYNAQRTETARRNGTSEGMTDAPQASGTAQDPRKSPVVSAAPRQAVRGGFALAAVALLLALAALAWTAWRELAPKSDSGAARMAQIEQRLVALDRDAAARTAAADQARGEAERRLAALGERVDAVQGRIAAISGAIDALSARIDQLAQETKNEPDPARFAGLIADSRRFSYELARLQEEVAGLNASLGERGEQRRGDNLILAIGQLREALARGAPYASALATLHAIGADEPAVAQVLPALEPHAERGVPTQADLRARFDNVAADVVRQARVSATQEWWRPIAERLSSLISVRRVGDVEGDSPAALVARAEQKLAAGDLAAAVAEVEKLNGDAAAPAQSWLADARARLAADAALARLSAQVLRSGQGAP
jgi:uroporphyrinogen-III synthase